MWKYSRTIFLAFFGIISYPPDAQIAFFLSSPKFKVLTRVFLSHNINPPFIYWDIVALKSSKVV